MSQPATEIRGDVASVDGGRRRLVLVLVLLLVSIGVGAGTWWSLREGAAPTLLGDGTSLAVDVDPQPLAAAAGFAVIVDPPDDPDRVLTFRGAPEVGFRTNTAAATARVAVCVGAVGRGPALVGSLSDIEDSCDEVRYVEDGTRLRWSGPSAGSLEYLILVVTPSRPGVATVDRVTYDYERESGESGRDVGTLGYTIRATDS